MSRPRAYFFGLTIIAAVAYPVTFAPGEDSFPLSSYPMFSYRRERPTIYFARAIGADGEERRVPPELVGSSEVMQAAVTVRRAIQGGKKRMRELCRAIAGRAEADAGLRGARIELVSAEIDPVAYFVEGPEPVSLRRHHRCRVREGGR
ncbi:MAG: hypothetical protein GX607_13200 [Myxococcales bacterium]|jgi:hypothetical protein|nr:hypothetical protein [Myxococcales bacterium]